ncbi:hypothetical protein [Ruegeria lacuscaerulensis]|uniref:hypothetical protein n=1 Tax=Ruegeria lacuscaerulensis TaxID=55218 RepID=UPI00147CD2CA|nr:hypothetical protein [Ruegeria lacuscaerulensis]
MREIASILNLKAQPERLDRIHNALVELGTKWRDTIVAAPVDFPIAKIVLPPSKRIRWLENNVEKPARKLLENLGDENNPYFSIWGTLDPDLNEFDREPARNKLDDLLAHLEYLISDLKTLKSEKAPHTGEMRFDIVCELVELFEKHCPELDASRGVYDAKEKRWIGHLPEFVDAAFAEVTGGDVIPGKKLDNLITIALKG